MNSTSNPTLGQSAVAPPKRDLGATFNAGLRGALPSKKRPPEPLADTAAEVAEAPTDAPVPEATPPKKSKNRQKASQAADAAVTKGRVIYLPEPTRDALATACAAQRKTRTVLVLEAVEATYIRLAALVAEDLKPRLVEGPLWDSVKTPNRQHQPAKRQVFITLTIQQENVIDQLKADTGARDRSHLITVALNAHLDAT